MVETAERELQILDAWRVLVKRRWVVYTCVAVLVTTVTLGSLLTQPVYTAVTRLQIERTAPNVLPFEGVVASNPDYLNDFYQTQYGLIQSRRVARDVIEALKLADHPEFRLRAAPGVPGDAPELGASRINILLGRLKVTPVRYSRLVDVAFSSTDPELAARVANRVAESYIAFNSAAQYNTSERASASLEEQIAKLQIEIDERERLLQKYARENDIIPVNDKQNITLKNLNDLTDAHTQAQAARIEKEARYAALKQASPASIPEVLESKLIQDLTAKSADLSRREAELTEKYKPDWPEMLRLRSEIEETRRRLVTERDAIYAQVLGAAESAWRTSANEEQYLAKALEEQKRLTQAMSLKEIEYTNLKLDIANRRATIEALAKRQSETSTSARLNDVASSNVRVVDAAEVPVRPSSPRVMLNAALSLLAGLGLGVALAFFFEHLDKSVKDAAGMQAAAGIATIGTIPALRAEGSRLRLVRGGAAVPEAPGARVELIAHEDPASKIAEAMREMRTALMVSRPGGPPRTLLVTSSNPGDGKTSVALNLAVTLAQLTKRVLLVDGDLRKPRLHRLLDVQNDEGLSNLLGGTGPVRPVPRPTAIAGLDLLPSGPAPPNPADLLDSDRFLQLLEAAVAAGYDHVILDSPPILAVADPAIMATRAEGVVIVARAGVTGRDALALAVQRLQHVKARLVGGVLNHLEMHHGGYYGRYDDYRRKREAGTGAERRSARARRRRAEG